MALLGGMLSKYLPDPACISLMLLLMLAATAGIGLFDELLSFQQIREAPVNPKRELVVSVIVFVLLQVVIVPVIWIGIALLIGASWQQSPP